eukprot:scaffold72242_cov60-Phaeocystis_antarctica.AAC.6
MRRLDRASTSSFSLRPGGPRPVVVLTPNLAPKAAAALAPMSSRRKRKPTEDDDDGAPQSSQSSQSLAAAASPLSPEETEKLANELCRYGAHT